ncbi:MAG: nickel pincer cofactor biosynthesis protein LarC2, partial [Frankiaceae bacterium]
AVLALLRAAGAPAAGGPVDVELCTPTGAALVTSLASGYGPLPPVVVEAVGTGAGSLDLPGRPNVVRLVVGSAEEHPAEAAILLETNVDDLDPRAWPSVLAALLGTGASDAWITPILMKKGRPAHTLSVLSPADQVAQVRRTMYEQTTTLGIREVTVAKHALRRDSVTVEVDGQEIRVKTGELPDGSRVNAMPEWEDVVRAARLLNRPVKSVLAAAQGWAAALPRRRQD